MKRRKNKELLIFILVLFFIYQIYFNYNEPTTNCSNDRKYFKVKQETIISFNHSINDDEWEFIPDYFIFIRRSGVFYSRNDSLISILLLANDSNVTSLKSALFSLQLINKCDQVIENFSIELHNKTLKRLLSFKLGYSAYRLDYSFDLKQYLLENVDFSSDVRINAKIYFMNLKVGMNVNILKYTRSNSLNVALCSKMYNLTDQNFESFKIWIKLNKLIGYDKLIIYNNSIPNEKFSSLFKLYSDFVQVKQYRRIPKFEKDQTTNYYNNLASLNMEALFLNERLVLNECFLENRLNYDFISVLDYDELIVPPSKVNIKAYLNDLKVKYAKSNATSFWFRYVTFLENKSIIKNFDIKPGKNTELFNLNQKLKFNFNQNESIEFQIDNISHFDFLINTKDHVFKINKLNDSLFNRAFMLREKSTFEFGFGKSVHFTVKPLYIGHHETMSPKQNSYKINYTDGYVSHFRSKLKLLKGTFDLTKLEVDLNYWNDYFFKLD
jgi:hypothetical protein